MKYHGWVNCLEPSFWVTIWVTENWKIGIEWIVNLLRPNDAYMRRKTYHHFSIGSDNGLALTRRQAIIWTNAEMLLIGFLGTKFNEILIEIHTFPFKKMHMKMSSGKWRPFCLGPQCVKETGFSMDTVHAVVCEHLLMSKLCARWIPRMMTLKMKNTRAMISTALMTSYNTYR